MDCAQANGGGECIDQSTMDSLMGYVNVTWVLMCTFFVVSMQLGFAMLEVGSCRAAHRGTVVLKNVLDSAISCIAFWLGNTWRPLSVTHSNVNDMAENHLLLFHSAFCATCVTICSGSMAERTHMGAYCCYAVVMSGIIYPVLAEAAWGTHEDVVLYREFHGRHNTGYRYHDFAGSGVVHLCGGCAALVGNFFLGRRILKPLDTFVWPESAAQQLSQQRLKDLEGLEDGDGVVLRPAGGWPRRFDSTSTDEKEFAQCSYLQVMGMFTLWVGWYGFNAGSTVSLGTIGRPIAGIVAWNTTLAACAGGLGAFIFMYCCKRRIDIGCVCNGVLSGLVAITASCDLATQHMTLCIGFLAGFVVYPLCSQALRSMRLDDPVDAIAVHAGCGLFGLTMVAFSQPDCNPALLKAGDMSEFARFCDSEFRVARQLAAQAWGALVIIACTSALIAPMWGSFVLSECIRATEGACLEQAEKMVVDTGAAAGCSGHTHAKWQELARQSTRVRGILRRSGWTDQSGFNGEGGCPQDPWQLRLELRQAREGWVESALEVEGFATLWKLARCCRFLNCLAVLRLRIAPAAELSGLGSAHVDSGRLSTHIQTAIKALSNEYAKQSKETEKSAGELEDQVKTLKAMVRTQGRLLNAMASWRTNYGNSSSNPPTPMGMLQGVPEQDVESGDETAGTRAGEALSPAGNAGTTGSMSSTAVPTSISHWSSSTASPIMTEVAEALPDNSLRGRPPSQAGGDGGSNGGADVRFPDNMSMSTMSDRSIGNITMSSGDGATPPPTLLGHSMSRVGGRPPERGRSAAMAAQTAAVNDLAFQLISALQAQHPRSMRSYRSQGTSRTMSRATDSVAHSAVGSVAPSQTSTQ